MSSQHTKVMAHTRNPDIYTDTKHCGDYVELTANGLDKTPNILCHLIVPICEISKI